jgi:hypothetical protein
MTDIFIITSVICTSTAAWSYTNERSCFNHQERFEQTLNSIASIKKYSPSSKILLVECSPLTTNMTNELIKNVDYFIQTYDNEDIRQACHESNKKGFGEVKKLEFVCKYITDNKIAFRRLFKLSGRYFLNESFDNTKFADDKYTFRTYPSCICTVLYSVPYSLFSNFTEQIIYCCGFYKTNLPTGLETFLPYRCMPRYHIEQLGVSGNVAVRDENNAVKFVII